MSEAVVAEWSMQNVVSRRKLEENVEWRNGVME
jgi:hypothetical protein